MPLSKMGFISCMCSECPQPCICCQQLPTTQESPEDATPADPAGKACDPEMQQTSLPEAIKSLMVGASIAKVPSALMNNKAFTGMGLPAHVNTAALEVEARRALGGEWSGMISPHLCGKDFSRSGSHDETQAVADKGSKIASKWSSEISYDRLEFSEQDTQVRRPKFVSAFPAALVPAKAAVRTSLCFRVAAFPPNRTVLTVGLARWPGFKSFFGKGFGEESDSWGLQWKAEDEESNTDRLRPNEGDLICITCDAPMGLSTISLNGTEVGSFCVPKREHFVLGATLSTECVLAIETQCSFKDL